MLPPRLGRRNDTFLHAADARCSARIGKRSIPPAFHHRPLATFRRSLRGRLPGSRAFRVQIRDDSFPCIGRFDVGHCRRDVRSAVDSRSRPGGDGRRVGAFPRRVADLKWPVMVRSPRRSGGSRTPPRRLGHSRSQPDDRSGHVDGAGDGRRVGETSPEKAGEKEEGGFSPSRRLGLGATPADSGCLEDSQTGKSLSFDIRPSAPAGRGVRG